MSSKIGFVGLGIMGKPMVKNLLKAGHTVTVYDIMPAGMDDVAAAGAEKGASPKDVASKTDIIITMVPDGPEVEQAVLGPNGVLEGAQKGLDRHRHELDQPDGVAESRSGARGEGHRLSRRAGERRRAESDRRHARDHGRRQARTCSTRWSRSSRRWDRR